MRWPWLRFNKAVEGSSSCVLLSRRKHFSGLYGCPARYFGASLTAAVFFSGSFIEEFCVACEGPYLCQYLLHCNALTFYHKIGITRCLYTVQPLCKQSNRARRRAHHAAPAPRTNSTHELNVTSAYATTSICHVIHPDNTLSLGA